MKKILTILFVLCAAISRAQYPLTQNLASDSTLVRIGATPNGAIRGGLINLSFTDTTAANLSRISFYAGAQIWSTSDSSLYVRQKSATGTFWFKVGGAGGGPTGSFWNLTGNTIAAVPAGFGIGTNSADNLPFKTDNTTRLILPSTGLARQSGGAWKSMMFDTTNFTWGYGDGTNIYNSDGTLSGTRTVTTGGNEINFYTDASNYVKYTPSTRTFETTVTNGNYQSILGVDDFSGVYGSSDRTDISGSGGFFNLGTDVSYLELSYKGNIGGLLNQVGSDDFISMLLAIENPYVGLAIDSANGTLIGKGTAANNYKTIRGLRVLPNWQIYMDSIDAGGTANDSVLVVQSDGKVVRRNAAAFGGSTPTLQQVLTAGSTLTTDNTIDVGGNLFTINNAGEFRIYGDFVEVGYDGYSAVSAALGASSLKGGDVSRLSILYLSSDSMLLQPSFAKLNIDSLRTWSDISDTLYKKPMTWDTRNGRWEYAANWFGNGSASYTASNGLTLSGSNFKLGGTLGENTTITQDGFTLGITDLIDFADTTNWKPVVVNTTGSGATAGTLRKATYWPGGGGSGITVGTTTITSGTNRRMAYNNSGVYGETAGVEYGNTNILWRSQSQAATDVAVVAKAHASQSANIFEVQNSSGTVIGRFESSGRLGFTDYAQVIGTDVLFGNILGDGYVTLQSNQSNGIKFRDNGGNLPFKFEFGSGSTPRSQLTAARELLYQGTDVASAAGAIALSYGNSFEITGTSSITLISNVNWQNGSEVTLWFTSTATLTDGTANSGTDIGMELAGNTNFTASAGASLTLQLIEIGGTQRWREKCRSVN